MRRLLVVLATTVAALAAAPPASASPAEHLSGSSTEHDVDPCGTAPAEYRFAWTGVARESARGGSMSTSLHGTLTVAVGGVDTYAGRFGVTDAFVQRDGASALTETFRFTLSAADGRRVVGSGVAHRTTNAGGDVTVSLDRGSLRCLG